MRWTKRHSKNAVAAKERKRLAAIESELCPHHVNIFTPRRSKPDFTIRIEDRFGERIQITARKYLGKIQISTGQSARQLCRAIEHLITKSA